ncbi:MAG TPA: hypothetical protein VIG40_00635 [Tissierellaceae bacterium]
MKKIYILALFCSSMAMAQTGVNTTNPMQVFHVDGKKDNPDKDNPNKSQEKNDVVITKDGYLGVGVIEPNSSLHVNGSYTGRLVDMEKNGVIDSDSQFVILSNNVNSVTMPNAENVVGGRIYTLRNNNNRSIEISGFNNSQTINTGSTLNLTHKIILDSGEMVQLVRSSSNANSGNTWYALYSKTKVIDNSAATYFLGGTVYSKFASNSGGIMEDKRVIGGADGFTYEIGTVTEKSSKGGIYYLKGNGYKISNPRKGVFDITFDIPFTEIYGMSVNIVDSYGSGTGSISPGVLPNPDSVGLPLRTNDNSQISFISNGKIRVKTGNQNGELANRSFAFLVTGK